VEAAATQQYRQLLSEAAKQRALAPESNAQLQRLRYIAQRIIPFTDDWNRRARQWKWEVNLIGSKELNAFCMPGGTIAFFYGILQQLPLSDDEVATIMGHEVAHALREHARERMGKSAATQLGAGALSALLGLGNLGNQVLGMGSQLLTLKFSREDESEADIVGMELAARAGYDPAAGVSLWQKMMAASRGEPLAFMSTHPTGETRIRDIQARLPRVQPLYAQASKPDRQFGPPAAKSASR
jgi:predicted Zn-dependent protease